MQIGWGVDIIILLGGFIANPKIVCTGQFSLGVDVDQLLVAMRGPVPARRSVMFFDKDYPWVQIGAILEGAWNFKGAKTTPGGRKRFLW